MTRQRFLKRFGLGLLGAGAVIACGGDDGYGTESSSGSSPGTTGGTSDPSTDSSAGSEAESGSGEETGSTGSTGAGGESTGGAAGCESDASVTISVNHGHELVVGAGDIEAGVEKTYDITGGSLHSHSVTLTADHFSMLSAGMSVMVTSSDAGHTHAVTVNC